MSPWILIALAGHILNGFAFLIDKILLSTSFKKSGTYAALIGGLSCFALPLLPWIKLPTGLDWLWTALFGSLFVIAVWFFFLALQRGEASRVVPIIGVLIPIFTLVDTSILIGEQLTGGTVAGFGLLIMATLVLTSRGKTGPLDKHTIMICVASAALFAGSSASGKAAYLHGEFFDVFVTSRIFAAIAAVAIVIFARGVKQELKTLLPSKDKARNKAEAKSIGMMLLGQASGAAGFVLVQYATSLGSAPLVNSLQAVQYAFLVMVAWFGGKKLAAVLHEDRRPLTIAIKSAAIVLVGCGLYLLTI